MYTKKELKTIQNYFINSQNKDYKAIHGKNLNSKEKRDLLSKLKEKLDDPKTYKKIEFYKGRIKTFVIASLHKCPFEGKHIGCWYLTLKGRDKNIQSEIKQIQKFFNNKSVSIKTSYSVKDKKYINELENVGFNVQAYKLKGNTNTALRAINIKGLVLNDGFKITIPKLSELKKIIELEIETHNNETSSVVSYKKESIKLMKNFMKDMIKNDWFYSISDEFNKPIAHIGFVINKGIGHVMTIAVSKDYQGQGLSYILYQAMFEELKKHNVSIYTGYTSTPRVLKQAKSLGRKPYLYTLFYKQL